MSVSKINTELIKEVFKSMKYCEETAETERGFGDSVQQQTPEDLSAFLDKFSKNNKWGCLKNEERENLLLRLASAIEKKQDSIAIFEKETTRIPTNYVKTKSLPFLVKCLRYYSTFCNLVKEKTCGVLLVQLSENSSLSSLGYILGPSLAAGYRIILLSPNIFNPTVRLLSCLADKAGFPEGTIAVLSDNVDMKLLCNHVTVIFNATNEKSIYNDLSIKPFATPVIVFDNSDLDSACDSIINSTWNNHHIFNLLPKEVFVQETVYKKFVKKFKEKLSNNNNFPSNNDKIKESLLSLISKAEKEGIEVFPKTANFGKTLFIGGRIIDKNYNTPYVSLSAFRNIDEGVALANNNLQGLSASVWTENIGLANYVAQKLDVANVWINSIDIYRPEISFYPRKYSGKGYFGGVQGFHELIHKTETPKSIFPYDDKREDQFSNAINAAKKAHQNWGNLEKYERVNKFRKVIQHIESIKNEIKSKSIPENWLNEWKILFDCYTESHYNFSIDSPVDGYNLFVKYESRGVLAMETENDHQYHNKQLLIASIVEGNALILLNACETLQTFYNQIAKELPNGVLNVVPHFRSAPEFATMNHIVDYYFNVYKTGILNNDNKLTTVSRSWSDVHNKVTKVKNVWSNIGQKL